MPGPRTAQGARDLPRVIAFDCTLVPTPSPWLHPVPLCCVLGRQPGALLGAHAGGKGVPTQPRAPWPTPPRASRSHVTGRGARPGAAKVPRPVPAPSDPGEEVASGEAVVPLPPAPPAPAREFARSGAPLAALAARPYPRAASLGRAGGPAGSPETEVTARARALSNQVK